MDLLENIHLAAGGYPASLSPMLSPWKLPSLGILDSRLQDFLQCCSPECNFQDHNLWAAPLLCLPLLWVKRWLFYFSSLTWSFPFIRWERFAASKGFSCHQGQSFDVKRLGIENCTCELSGKAKQRKLVGRVLRMGGRRKTWRGSDVGAREAVDHYEITVSRQAFPYFT